MLFSERYGYKPVREIIQKERMDLELRNKLWSLLYEQMFSKDLSYNHLSEKFIPLRVNLFKNFFKKPIDEMLSPLLFNKFIKKYLYEGEWFQFYDLIEFIIINQRSSIYDGYETYFNPPTFINEINKVLQSELSAYQVINNHVTEITSEQEIQSIEDALANTTQYSGVQKHLNQALKLMSDREKPDYRNSIKESISAVESICKIITTNDKASLGQALKIIEDKFGLHPALKSSLSQLYGYTSDADGIRHAMLEESNLTYIDAKFMLVACTNFINYLIDKTK